MPRNAEITATPGTLPVGYCFTTLQTLLNDFINLSRWFLPGVFNTYNFGDTAPAPEDRDKPWFRKFGDSSPDRWYSYRNGLWVSRHPLSAPAAIMYAGTLASLPTYDGGANEAVTDPDTTGPMWEEIPESRARFPLHPGTLPSTKVVNLGDVDGEENHTTTDKESVYHTHNLPTDPNGIRTTLSPGSGNNNDDAPSGAGFMGKATLTGFGGIGNATNDTSPHNNMPPYYGIYFIRRTARVYYRV